MKTLLAGATLALAALAADARPCVDFSRQATAGCHDYATTTESRTYAPDGTYLATQSYAAVVTVTRDESGRQTLVCRSFTYTGADGVAKKIPALTGWTHVLDVASKVVLGIPHGDFKALTYEDGSPLPVDVSYGVYNTFVDFYAFTNVFGDPAPSDSIAELKAPGQTVPHLSANSKVSVALEGSIDEGSYFQNGAATLTFKGYVGSDDDAAALVGFDSGDASFAMSLEPMPGTKMKVKGGSHYWGEMSIDTASRWVRESHFTEIVLSEALFAGTQKFDSIIIRSGKITAL